MDKKSLLKVAAAVGVFAVAVWGMNVAIRFILSLLVDWSLFLSVGVVGYAAWRLFGRRCAH